MRGYQQPTRDCQWQMSAAFAVVLARKRGSLRRTAPAGSILRCVEPKELVYGCYSSPADTHHMLDCSDLQGVHPQPGTSAARLLCCAVHAHCKGVHW